MDIDKKLDELADRAVDMALRYPADEQLLRAVMRQLANNAGEMALANRLNPARITAGKVEA